LNALAEFADVL